MRITPKKNCTPVIAGRVPETLHRQIKQAAKRSGRSMSDELAHRAAMSFEWEKMNSTIERCAQVAEANDAWETAELIRALKDKP